MPDFLSRYNGINYKVPGTNKYAKFEGGKLQTDDNQVANYLRRHKDFGATLTEVGAIRSATVTVGIDICPVCGKVYKDSSAFAKHKETCKPKPKSAANTSEKGEE